MKINWFSRTFWYTRILQMNWLVQTKYFGILSLPSTMLYVRATEHEELTTDTQKVLSKKKSISHSGSF